MKDRSNNKESENTNVEFGQEFGDMNSSKFFEYRFMNQDQQKLKKNNKKN